MSPVNWSLNALDWTDMGLGLFILNEVYQRFYKNNVISQVLSKLFLACTLNLTSAITQFEAELQKG